LTVGLFVD
jgi:hypothetical protein